MSSGLLDFFTLEAGEYLERLDGLLAQAGVGPPALDPFLTDARALRGSATMARQTAIADVAASLERLARALRESSVPWDLAVRGAVIAAVDDLKILVRAVRAWTAADEQRARARVEELTRLAPVRPRRSSAGITGGSSLVYLASETGDIATVLEGYAAAPATPAALLSMLPRVRALRGMASLRDLPPLADVVEATEDAVKTLELGASRLADAQMALLASAAAVLRRASQDLRAGGTPDPRGAEAQAFARALDATLGEPVASEDVVPISSLYFSDAGPHVVSAAPSPATTAEGRFRLDIVSQAEHLQRLIHDARNARDDAARTRAARGLRAAMHSLRATALSFGEHDVAEFITRTEGPASSLDAMALSAVSEASTLLSNPSTERARIIERLRLLGDGRSVDRAIGAGFSPVARGTPASVEKTEPHLSTVLHGARSSQPPARVSAAAGTTPAPLAEPGLPPASPQGDTLRSLLATGIAGLTRLDNETFSPPAHIEEEAVPIEELFYRGRAALDRALEIGDEIRARGGSPNSAELEELFALLELATTE
jgi:chemotaxis protein histidine kinase CheA